MSVLLKNSLQKTDKLLSYRVCSYNGGTFMSKKHEGNNSHHKKKLTKKEQKAINHAKLMANKGQGSNVVDINAYREDQQNKKAA